MNSEQKKIISLGYWNVRGRGEPIRLLLNYLKLSYIDKIYGLDNREEWFNFKNNHEELFINLPYLEVSNQDGSNKNTFVESESICAFICKNFGGESLLGDDLILVNKMRGVVEDVKYYLSRYAYHKDPIEGDELYLQIRLFPILQRLNTYFSRQNRYLLDFILYESLKTLEKINKSYLQKYPLLAQYVYNIQNLEQIKEYLSSSRFYKDFLFYGDPSPL